MVFKLTSDGACDRLRSEPCAHFLDQSSRVTFRAHVLSRTTRLQNPEAGCERTLHLRSLTEKSPTCASRTATDRGGERWPSRRIPHHNPDTNGERRTASSPPPPPPPPPPHEGPPTIHRKTGGLGDALGRPFEGATTTAAADPRRGRGGEGPRPWRYGRAVPPSLSGPTASMTLPVERTSSPQLSAQVCPDSLSPPKGG